MLKAPITSAVPQELLKPLVESPLNDLDKEEFLKQYNELPNSHIFKVSKELSDSGKKEETTRTLPVIEYLSDSLLSIEVGAGIGFWLMQ